MDNEMEILDGRILLSRSFLLKVFSEKTVQCWTSKERIKDVVFYYYDKIPERSRKSLPNESTLLDDHVRVQKVYVICNDLLHAQTFDFTKYLPEFDNDQVLSTKEKTDAAKLCAVFTKLIERKKSDLQYQFEAFSKLYPNKYKGKNGKISLSRALKKCKKEGVLSVAVDGKKYGNNREENARFNKAALKYILTSLVADGEMMFSCSEMLQMINQDAKENGYPEVKISWVKKWRADILKNVVVAESRYGKMEANRLLPHTKFIAATQVHYQWQIDGMRPAFWGNKFESYSYVRVLDSHSKKIIGWSFGKTENKEIIIDAIRDAVKNTLHLPFEVVADNHSFNKSQEAENLQKLFDSKGSKWTITSNPRHKIIIERENQNINKLCKRYYGYLGQGIKSKSIEARPKDELKAEYAKNFHSEQDIKAIMLNVTHEYNNRPQKNGKTPNQMFAESTPAKAIPVTMWDFANLLNAQCEKQIRSGQITFAKGFEKIEFQLPAHLFRNYNNTKVLVKYSDLKDGIYLFDIKTGECFADLKPKEAIHNAKADQTQKDIDILYKQKGKAKGIKSQAVKELENLTNSALSIDPDAHARVSKMTTPKDILKELEQNGLINQAADRDIKTDLIQSPKQNDFIPSLKPKVKDTSNPFSVTNNVISKVDPLTLLGR